MSPWNLILDPPLCVVVGSVYLFLMLLWVFSQHTSYFPQVHYLSLSLFSLVCFIGVGAAAFTAATQHGIEHIMCVPHGQATDVGITFWLRVFHYSKYAELVDTILILARGRQLTFLHVFHHGLVLVQSWTWMHGNLSFTWAGVLVNSFVHVIMYYFYWLGVRGVRVSWKSRITQLQIVQFLCSFAVYAWYVQYHFKDASVVEFWEAIRDTGTLLAGRCQGFELSLFSIFFNCSLLALFLRLAISSSRGGEEVPKSKKRGDKLTKTN